MAFPLIRFFRRFGRSSIQFRKNGAKSGEKEMASKWQVFLRLRW
jgi:hypothetical protein